MPILKIPRALPDSLVFTKTLPWNTRLTDQEILNSLALFYSDIAVELVFDFKRLNNTHIQILAAPKQLIDPYLKNSLFIDSEAYAIKRALDKLNKNADITAFYFTDPNTLLISLTIFNQNDLIFFHEDKSLETSQLLFQKAFPELSHPKSELLYTNIDNKKKLLKIGLDLHQKTDWNLLPWRTKKAQAVYYAKLTGLGGVVIFITSLLFLFFTLYQHPNHYFLQSAKATSATQLTHQAHTASRLLLTLPPLAPAGIYINHFSLDLNKLVISGLAVTEFQINYYLHTLTNIPSITQTDPPEIRSYDQQPPYRYSFKINLAINYPSHTTPNPDKLDKSGFTITPITLTGTYSQIIHFIQLTNSWQGPLFLWQDMSVTSKNNLLKISISVIFFTLP